MGIEYCSTDGASVWCPDVEAGGERRFIRATYGGANSNDYNPRPDAGPLPAYVELANGQRCWFGIVPGNPRTDAEHYYSCPGFERLWAMNGQGVFTTDGTWTSLKGAISNSRLTTVEVARAVFFE